MQSFAPVAIFTYNRPEHTRQTLEALVRNDLAKESKIFVFSDGPKSQKDLALIEDTRRLIKAFKGFKTIELKTSAINLGLSQSIMQGVTKIINEYGKIIVLEDDMLTSKYFLTYLNDGLNRYEDDERVGSIHSYFYPIDNTPEFFFSRGGDCWGWATWQDRWALLQPDSISLLKSLKADRSLLKFDFVNGDRMLQMLVESALGKNNSWFIRWHASLFLKGKITLQPGRSFLHNIGTDGTGVHCEDSGVFDVDIRSDYAGLPEIKVMPDTAVERRVYHFFRSTRTTKWYRNFLRRMWYLLQAERLVRFG